MGIKFEPDVVNAERESLSIFAMTNPGSLVTISLKNLAGAPKMFVRVLSTPDAGSIVNDS